MVTKSSAEARPSWEDFDLDRNEVGVGEKEDGGLSGQGIIAITIDLEKRSSGSGWKLHWKLQESLTGKWTFSNSENPEKDELDWITQSWYTPLVEVNQAILAWSF